MDINDMHLKLGADHVRNFADRNGRKYKKKPETNGEAPPARLQFIDISAWRRSNRPEQDWGVRPIFPRRNVCILSGDGGDGKSTLGGQLAIAHILGEHWIGHLPEQGPVIYFNCEEEAGQLHYRLADALALY